MTLLYDLLLVSLPSGLLAMRLYDPSALLSVQSHLRCGPDVIFLAFISFFILSIHAMTDIGQRK